MADEIKKVVTLDSLSRFKNYLDGILANKQALLASGTTIKTINGQSILGSGNISISGGTGVYHYSGRYIESENDEEFSFEVVQDELSYILLNIPPIIYLDDVGVQVVYLMNDGDGLMYGVLSGESYVYIIFTNEGVFGQMSEIGGSSNNEYATESDIDQIFLNRYTVSNNYPSSFIEIDNQNSLVVEGETYRNNFYSNDESQMIDSENTRVYMNGEDITDRALYITSDTSGYIEIQNVSGDISYSLITKINSRYYNEISWGISSNVTVNNMQYYFRKGESFYSNISAVLPYTDVEVHVYNAETGDEINNCYSNNTISLENWYSNVSIIATPINEVFCYRVEYEMDNCYLDNMPYYIIGDGTGSISAYAYSSTGYDFTQAVDLTVYDTSGEGDVEIPNCYDKLEHYLNLNPVTSNIKIVGHAANSRPVYFNNQSDFSPESSYYQYSNWPADVDFHYRATDSNIPLEANVQINGVQIAGYGTNTKNLNNEYELEFTLPAYSIESYDPYCSQYIYVYTQAYGGAGIATLEYFSDGSDLWYQTQPSRALIGENQTIIARTPYGETGEFYMSIYKDGSLYSDVQGELLSDGNGDYREASISFNIDVSSVRFELHYGASK